MTKKYFIPETVTPYLKYLNSTGGNEPQVLLDKLENEKHFARTNIIAFTLAMQLEAQIILLRTLMDQNLLRSSDEALTNLTQKMKSGKA